MTQTSSVASGSGRSFAPSGSPGAEEEWRRLTGRAMTAEELRPQRLRERLRAEWLAGPEEAWRQVTRRPMTAKELKRVLRRYPGDVWARPNGD
ncbi:MAG: hypothetical protein ABJC39_07045 [Chloroflexota bacterium]